MLWQAEGHPGGYNHQLRSRSTPQLTANSRLPLSPQKPPCSTTQNKNCESYNLQFLAVPFYSSCYSCYGSWQKNPTLPFPALKSIIHSDR